MTRTQVGLLAAALTTALCASAAAQSMKMTVRPESKVTVAGGSNLHDWICTTNTLRATIVVDSGFESAPLTQVATPITEVAVAIPVKTLKCGKGKMDENLYKALKSEQFPEIKYLLKSYKVNTDLTSADELIATTVGELTVAGTTAIVEIPLTAVRQRGGSAVAEGSVGVKMTDFGIKPPTALLGTLRTKNEIAIAFKVLLDKDVVVALTQ